MINAQSSASSVRRFEPLAQLRIWHLLVIVLYAGVAIFDLKDQRLSEPPLIVLATVGLVGYGVLAWLGWRVAGRFEVRLGAMPVIILYLISMAILFLTATMVYLV